MSALRKFVLFLAVLVVTIPLVFLGIVYSKLKTLQVNGDFSMLSTNNFKFDNKITNILLVGSDARPGENVSRSDSMMILTVDGKNKSLKLTSLGRDTYVNISGHGFEKLTHAYAYGKEALLIQTIEENFKLDIQNYAKVDFFSFMDIVDTIGGIEVTIEENEINEMNKFIKECYSWDKKPNKPEIQYIKKPGKQKLVGYQALTYARIRKSDGTMQRDNRQRLVIEAIIKKVNTLPLTKYPKLLDTVLPYVKTNMNPTDILFLGREVLAIGNLDHLMTMQFPLHPENEVRLPGAGYVIPFGEYELEFLHSFIFKNMKPTKGDIDRATEEWKNGGKTKKFKSNAENNLNSDSDNDTESYSNGSSEYEGNDSDYESDN